MEEVVLPEGLISIAKYCFYNNNKLKKVTLPLSLEKIGHESFSPIINEKNGEIKKIDFNVWYIEKKSNPNVYECLFPY